MLKEDTYCSYGTLTISNVIRDLGANADVAGIIIDADTGGGAVNSVPPLAEAITFARRSKPVVCLADTLASAGIWSMSYCDEIWASNTISSSFGSIGVMYSYQIFSKKYLESIGIEEGNVYPDESNFKNLPFEELMKGNTEPLKVKVLSPLAKTFQADIKRNIKSIDLTVEGIINGEMFFAKDALKHGMIQGIGNIEDVVARIKKLAKSGTTGNSAHTNNHSPKTLTEMKYATLCTLLGLTGLEFGKDGKASLSKENIATIQGAYKFKNKADLQIKGLEYDTEGYAAFSEAEMQALEDALNAEEKPAVNGTTTPKKETPTPEDKKTPEGTNTTEGSAAKEKTETGADAALTAFMQNMEANMEKRFQGLEDKITGTSASGTGRVIQLSGSEVKNANTKNMKAVFESALSFNQATPDRPWNCAALGLAASTEIDTTVLNSDLGEYIRVNGNELQNLLIGDQLEAIFPTLSGFTGKSATLGIFIDEVIQAYQKAWTPKGGISIQPEKLELQDVKIDIELTDLKTTLKGWLSGYNKEGSQAYKLSFVGYLLKLILMRSRQDDNIAAIKGVYKAPIAGQPGKAINTRDGLYQLVRNAVAKNKVKPFALGNWNQANIVNYLRDFILAVPETIRDRSNLALYVPKTFIEMYWAAKRLQEGNYPTYDASKTTVPGFDNIRLIGVPYAGNTQRLILTYIGNINQVMNIVEEKGLITLEQSKRVVNAFGDYEAAITIGYIGKEEANASDIKYENQAIFVNDADEPETYYVGIDADVTVPSVSVHTSIETSANTKATAITDIADRKAGMKIRVRCGSTTNASTIATGNNFILGSNWTPTSVGDELILIVRDDLKMVEYQRLSSALQAIELEANIATPSLGSFANGTKFITNDSNTAAVAITNFTNAVVGTEFTLYASNPATSKTTIANSGNFVLTAAWAESPNGYIKLMQRPDGKFVETARG